VAPDRVATPSLVGRRRATASASEPAGADAAPAEEAGARFNSYPINI